MILYTIIREFIRKHPQRTTGLLLVVFGSLQTSLALFKEHMPPLVDSIITTAFGVVVTVLGYIKTESVKPEEPTE